MVRPKQQKFNINQSDDSSEYVVGFRHQALTLIIEACNMLKADGLDYTDTDEPVISGELVRFARLYSENENSPEWACPYTIQDQQTNRRAPHH